MGGRCGAAYGGGDAGGRETGFLRWGAGAGLGAKKPGFLSLTRYLTDLLLGVLGEGLKANMFANVGSGLKGDFGLIGLG